MFLKLFSKKLLKLKWVRFYSLLFFETIKASSNPNFLVLFLTTFYTPSFYFKVLDFLIIMISSSCKFTFVRALPIYYFFERG